MSVWDSSIHLSKTVSNILEFKGRSVYELMEMKMANIEANHDHYKGLLNLALVGRAIHAKEML